MKFLLVMGTKFNEIFKHCLVFCQPNFCSLKYLANLLNTMKLNSEISICGSELKVGWMTWTIWVTFLEGQVGLICKLNYLDVTQISHVL